MPGRIALTLLFSTFVILLDVGAARCTEAIPQARRNAVGSLFPFSLDRPHLRARARQLYSSFLARGQQSYVPNDEITDPLGAFKQSGDRSAIPDPRSGGRGNNSNDVLTNRILAWLLYEDEAALEDGLLHAEWLVEVLDQQDHAHVQRHPTLALYALATRDAGQRERLLNGFLSSYRTLQSSRFWVDREGWMIGLAGIRPFLRACGAAHRFAFNLERLIDLGVVTREQVEAVGLVFGNDTDGFLDRVSSRISEFMSWRKMEGDQEPRGWQTSPGEWRPGDSVTFWPYLDSRVVSGRDSTWFHYGQIFSFEMLSIKAYYPQRFHSIFQRRTSEVAEWAFVIGADFLSESSSGRHMVSRRDWFFPTNPQLQIPFHQYTSDDQDLHGENTYCLLPGFYFVRGYTGWKSWAVSQHVASSKFSLFDGEVNFAALMTLYLWRL